MLTAGFLNRQEEHLDFDFVIANNRVRIFNASTLPNHNIIITISAVVGCRDVFYVHIDPRNVMT